MENLKSNQTLNSSDRNYSKSLDNLYFAVHCRILKLAVSMSLIVSSKRTGKEKTEKLLKQ